jgi:dGTPase
MRAQIGAIRGFLMTRMYRHWRVARMRAKAATVVEELFERFLAAPGLLPPEWGDACAARPEAERARIVADYIAGMTDRFALEEHAKLTNPLTRA